MSVARLPCSILCPIPIDVILGSSRYAVPSERTNVRMASSSFFLSLLPRADDARADLACLAPPFLTRFRVAMIRPPCEIRAAKHIDHQATEDPKESGPTAAECASN